MAALTLKESLHAAKAEFVSRLVAVLVDRTDLSQKQIGRDFGVSESFIKKLGRRSAVPRRKRGPKPKRYTGARPKRRNSQA
jgi:transposase